MSSSKKPKSHYPAKMKKEDKIQLLGEELIKEVEARNELVRIMQGFNDRLESLEDRKSPNGSQMRNELTYLHNEVVDIQKLLGLLGDVPKVRPAQKHKPKYK